MLSSFRNLTLRRVLVMLLGIVLLSIGVALFDFSRMGNDPSTSAVIALGDQTGLGLSRMMLLCNSVYFIVEILLARAMIGLGTFVNWTCIGPIAEVLLARMYRVPWLCEGDVSFPVRLGIMLLGVLILLAGLQRGRNNFLHLIFLFQQISLIGSYYRCFFAFFHYNIFILQLFFPKIIFRTKQEHLLRCFP